MSNDRKQLRQNNLMTVQQMLDHSKQSLMAAIPKHLTYDRLARVALTEFRTNPKLLECTPASLMASFVKASQLGLEVGSALGHAYLVPFWSKKLGGLECQMIVGYRGLITLARRSGEIQSISARVVRARDFFELEYGLDEKLRHIPSTDDDPGDMIYVYAVARLMGGGIQYEVMTRSEVAKIRDESLSKLQDYMRATSPWVVHEPEMWRKTVIRRLVKYLPISIELADALAADDDREAIDITEYSEIEGSTDPEDLRRDQPTRQKLQDAPEQPQDPAPTKEPEPAPEWPKERDGVLYDSADVPWNERFHASTRALLNDFTWRMRRGHDPQLYARWLDGLKAQAQPNRQEAARQAAEARIAEAGAAQEGADPQPDDRWNHESEATHADLIMRVEAATTVVEIDAIEREAHVASLRPEQRNHVLSIAADMRAEIESQ